MTDCDQALMSLDSDGDQDGPFPCELPLGHDGPHKATDPSVKDPLIWHDDRSWKRPA